jgi:16S rRNA (cytidine1402-2'-O)-methyltransferase
MPKLILVPTPVGNLEDITLRAIRILKEADLVLAEDTRKTGFLLKHFGISNKMLPYHKFNEHKSLEHYLQRISECEMTALVTDAGTPGISDPGFLIVRECIQAGIEVECLPGPVAFIPALVNSGLPTDHFIFEGFLPVKKGRQTKLKELALQPYTMILYESPFRLVKTLGELSQYLGADRQASVSRELTKIYEETQRGSLPELIAYFEGKSVKGEIVIIVEGNGG